MERRKIQRRIKSSHQANLLENKKLLGKKRKNRKRVKKYRKK